jgi:hypothetical protein
MVDPNSSFNKPKGFENKLAEVKRKIASLQIKVNNSHAQFSNQN